MCAALHWAGDKWKTRWIKISIARKMSLNRQGCANVFGCLCAVTPVRRPQKHYPNVISIMNNMKWAVCISTTPTPARDISKTHHRHSAKAISRSAFIISSSRRFIRRLAWFSCARTIDFTRSFSQPQLFKQHFDLYMSLILKSCTMYHIFPS